MLAEWRDGAIVVRDTGLPGALAVVPAGALGLESELVLTAGSWVRSADEARFTPRFASCPATEFAILAESSDAHTPWRELARVRVPARDRAPTTVVELIDPGVVVVPANLLRFSITFSAEMDEGSAAGHIRLLDESGADIPAHCSRCRPSCGTAIVADSLCCSNPAASSAASSPTCRRVPHLSRATS